MHSQKFILSLACFFASIQFAVSDAAQWKAGWKPATSAQTDLLAAKGLAQLKAYYAANGAQGNCTLENVTVRREWYA
jgi:hypothetical protein